MSTVSAALISAALSVAMLTCYWVRLPRDPGARRAHALLAASPGVAHLTERAASRRAWMALLAVEAIWPALAGVLAFLGLLLAGNLR
jgi:hypothetical protein